ncbi:MAG: hypothetical protein KAI17_03325 [Thiotrichaceae bacterium]|nr:hypothetical protein [Thiotrichaceae bacterium]
MSYYSIQTGFSRGEISPQFYDRQDFQGWNYALKKARNVLITTSAIEVRPGSNFIANIGEADKNYKLVKMQFSDTDIFYGIIKENAIDIYEFFTDVFQQTLVTTITDDEIPKVTFTFFSLALIITRSENTPEVITLDTLQPVGSQFSIANYTYTIPPQYDYDPTAYVDTTFTLSTVTAGNDGTLTIPLLPGGFEFTSDFEGGLFSALGTDEINFVGTFRMNTFDSNVQMTGRVISSFNSATIRGDEATVTAQAFTTERGFPIDVGGFQNRVIFAATKSVPTGFWASSTGNAQSFDTGTAQASNAIVFTINEKDVSEIRHVVNNETIQFATNSGLYIFNTAFVGGLTPTNVNLIAVNRYNYSQFLQPVVYDSQTIGLIEGGQTLIGTNYGGSDNYESIQINTMATHICDTPTDSTVLDGQVEAISTLAYFVNTDGTLLQYQSQRSQDINGWSLSTTGVDGEDKYKNILNVEDQIYQLVERGDATLLEKQEFGLRLDSVVTKEEVSEFTVVTGLTHLEGRTVTALVSDFDNGGVPITQAEGYLSITDLLVTGGEVTLPYEVKFAQVGLFFTPEVTILEPLIPGYYQGSMFYQRKKRYKVKISFFESVGVEIKSGDKIWEQPSLDYGALAFKPPALTTEVADFTTGQPWGQAIEDITITQSVPYAFTIKGVTQYLVTEDEI